MDKNCDAYVHVAVPTFETLEINFFQDWPCRKQTHTISWVRKDWTPIYSSAKSGPIELPLICSLGCSSISRTVTSTYSTRTSELTAILASSGPYSWFRNNNERSPMSDKIMLLCWVQGDRLDRGFLVRIKPSDTVADLKKAIRAEKSSFQKIDSDTDSLQLWKVSECR